jgi:hypothetical protein
MSDLENTLTCAFHPNRETRLRCNRCDKPICIKCATHTPTGYRCPECIRSQQKIFVTTKWFDFIIAALISGAISYAGSLLTGVLGFYTIFIAMGAGYLAVVATKKAISNRRSPLLAIVMSVSALLASLLPVFFYYYRFGFWFGYDLIWRLAYAVITAGNIFYQLRN